MGEVIGLTSDGKLAPKAVELLQDMIAGAGGVNGFLRSGNNVSFSYDDTAGTLTISASGGTGSSSADPEVVRDIIGAALIGQGMVSVVANDLGDIITISGSAALDAALAARLRPRGAFAPGVAYKTNDLIVSGAQTFYALQDHTSANPAPTGTNAFWQLIGGGGGSSLVGAFVVRGLVNGVQELRNARGTLPSDVRVGWDMPTPPSRETGYALDNDFWLNF
jgi:hypothetical protein